MTHTETPTAGTYTCTHSWHVGPDGLPLCKGTECKGYTVACGQGLIPCPRHAEPAAPARTVTITISASSRPDTHAHAAMSVPTAGAPRTYFALLPDEDAVTGWITRATAVAGNHGYAVEVVDTR